MKSKLLVLLVIVFSYQSCCLRKGEEIDRITFTVEEKAKIPYADNQSIDMTTNEDFEFQLTANVRSRFYSNQEHCEDYISYEDYEVNLLSDLPSLSIGLSLRTRYNEVDDAEILFVDITINGIYFTYDLNAPLETLEIDGVTYTDVYRYVSIFDEDPITEVFFNEIDGILRINYLNGDYVQID